MRALFKLEKVELINQNKYLRWPFTTRNFVLDCTPRNITPKLSSNKRHKKANSPRQI